MRLLMAACALLVSSAVAQADVDCALSNCSNSNNNNSPTNTNVNAPITTQAPVNTNVNTPTAISGAAAVSGASANSVNLNANRNTLVNRNDLSNRNSNTNFNSDYNANYNSQGQFQGQGQGQSQSVSDSGNSSVSISNPRQPVSTAYAAPLVASEDTCMGSSSIGGQAVGFGLSIGTTWDDDNCRRLKNARQLASFGFQRAGVALLCVDEDVAAAMATAGTPCPGGEAPVQTSAVEREESVVVAEAAPAPAQEPETGLQYAARMKSADPTWGTMQPIPDDAPVTTKRKR